MTLIGFYIAVVLLVIGSGIAVCFLFKIGKESVAVWLIGTAIVFLCFGVPIFILENHHPLFHETPFTDPATNYYIEFSPDQSVIMKFVMESYRTIWAGTHKFVYLYLHHLICRHAFLSLLKAQEKAAGRIENIRKFMADVVF